MATMKYSRQRDSIKEFLLTRYDHPTADVVYDNIRRIYPHISLGTVYRNLSLLSSVGQIRRLTTGDGKEHFDGNAAPHDHFVCTGCGKIIDFGKHAIRDDKTFKNAVFNGRVDSHSTIFYGLCADCLKKES